ncbi:hypothetical protein AB0B66_33740 [Catellatospora sp. NPDC049111]|uniref:hypothetical protein n=1 Tax=Catellatospora sp. NPDC049111 TaxID=3155271 RepID=UPI0033CB11B6
MTKLVTDGGRGRRQYHRDPDRPMPATAAAQRPTRDADVADPLSAGPAHAYQALVFVRLPGGTAGEQFTTVLRTHPAVLSAWWVAADADVRLSCPTLKSLDDTVSALRATGAAVLTTTHLLLRPITMSE